jgi:hypothetical protein
MSSAWRLATRLVIYELGLWRSLARWIARQPAGRAAGARTFGYAGPVTPVLIAFILISAIEIPVVVLLLPWNSARRILAALGAYGVFWMIALLASLRVHPHVIDDAGIRIRYGLGVDYRIPWDAVASAEASRSSRSSGRSGKPQLDESRAGRILHIPITSVTNVAVSLRGPISLPLTRDRREEVTEIRFFVDDPRAFVALAKDRPASQDHSRDAQAVAAG